MLSAAPVLSDAPVLSAVPVLSDASVLPAAAVLSVFPASVPSSVLGPVAFSVISVPSAGMSFPESVTPNRMQPASTKAAVIPYIRRMRLFRFFSGSSDVFPPPCKNSSGRGVYSAPGLFISSGMGYSHSVFPRFIGVPLLTLSMVSGVHGSPYHLLWTSTWGYGHSTPSLRKPSSRSWFKIRFAANTFFSVTGATKRSSTSDSSSACTPR